MLNIRKSAERGHVKFSWLEARPSFSFGNYYDPRFMGFRNLRVINEDKIAPSRGFPTHGHQDMEIITYMISGALEHKDSMGNRDVIRPGEIQHMSAGSGYSTVNITPQIQKKLMCCRFGLNRKETELSRSTHRNLCVM